MLGNDNMAVQKHALPNSMSLGNCDKERNTVLLLYISKCCLISIFLTQRLRKRVLVLVSFIM